MNLKNFESLEEKIAYTKKMYDYCEKNNWDYEKIDEYAESLNVSGSKVRINAKLYVKKYMGLSDEQVAQMLEQIDKIIKEQRAKHYLLSLPKTNELLKEKGIVTRNLWNNDEEKKEVLEYIYKYCESTKYHSEKVVEVGKKFGILSYQKIFRLAKMYAVEYLGMDSEEFDDYRKNVERNALLDKLKNKKKPLNDFFKALLEESDASKQIELIDKFGQDIYYLKNKAFDWAIVHGKVEDCEILRAKLNNYSKKIRAEVKLVRQEQKEREKTTKLIGASDMISSFVNSSAKSIDLFCKTEGFKKNDFDKNLKLVSEKDPELFSLYKDKVKKLSAVRYSSLIKMTKNIILQISNGINFGSNATRPFDIIDYFSATKLSYDELLNVTKSELIADEVRIFRKFMNQNEILRFWNSGDVKKCYESKHIIGAEIDDFGNVINPGHELTLNEKESIINYIKQNNIPLCDKTYNCVLRRYSSGILVFDKETNNMVLKKNH